MALESWWMPFITLHNKITSFASPYSGTCHSAAPPYWDGDGETNSDRLIIVLFLVKIRFYRWKRQRIHNTVVSRYLRPMCDKAIPGSGSLIWSRFIHQLLSLITRFMGPTWDPSGAYWTQMVPVLAPWTLLSGVGIDVPHQGVVGFYNRPPNEAFFL